MNRSIIAVFISLIAWSYFGIFQLPYYVWAFALSQNWFTQNGLILFKDVIYHHTQLPLFVLLGMSQLFGNTADMLRISSFILLIFFGFGIFLFGRKISEKVGLISFAIFLITFFPLFQNFNIEEMMASAFCLYSVYFFFRFWDRLFPLQLLLSGVFAALAIMSKQSVGLIIVVYLLVAGLQFFENRKLKASLIKGSLYFMVGGLLGTLPFFAYYLVTNSLGNFLYWNIIFNFTIYPKQSTPYAFKEGMAAAGWLFVSLTPALYIIFKEKTRTLKLPLVLLTLSTIFLSTSLLPSFLGYKILPFYPYPLILWAIVLTRFNKSLIKVFVVLGAILLLPILKSFYIDYLPTDAFNKGFIVDYGEDELKVVSWLEENTIYKEPIMNLGNHYVTTLAKRLPQNKYVYLFPWLVSPFDESTREILNDPPHIVIIDWRTFSDFPVLNKWPFISYVKNNYKSVVRYGTYEIFSNKK